MRGPLPYDGRAVIADTSAWIEIDKPTTSEAARRRFAAALREGLVFSSPVVRLELYKGARSAEELEAVDDLLRPADEIPLPPAIADLAVDTVRSIATPGSTGRHRIGVPDLLIAATAHAWRMGVLTVNWRDFERVAPHLRIWLYHPLHPGRRYLPAGLAESLPPWME